MVMSKIAVFDIDGTLFRWQLFHELVFELKRSGQFTDSVALQLDEALLRWQSRDLAWHKYEHHVVEAIRKHIAQISPEDFVAAAHAVVENSGHKIYNFTKQLAHNLKQQDYYLLGLTGSYQEVAEPFTKRYGFDDCIGALLEQKDGRFTGKVTRETYSNKAALVKEYVEANGLTLEGSVMIGDSAGDIPMLELASRPVAFNPSEELLDVALERGWEIVIERKNIAYNLKKGTDGHVVLEKTDRF
jgi:HAD superfamily hydrolase (TIGR01490 family)